MISRYTYKDLTWIDLESPSREEITLLREEFDLPQPVCGEIQTSSLRSKADLYDNLIFLIFRFPRLERNSDEADKQQEVDFIVGKEFIITVRYGLVDPILEFARSFELDADTGEHRKTKLHAGFIFVEMMRELYQTSLRELEDVIDVIKDIEVKIFQKQEELMVRRISETNRKLLDFKQAIRFHQDILSSYEVASKEFFGEGYSYQFSRVVSSYNKVNSLLESNRDAMTELQRTNDSLLSTRSNEIMKTFTIMTFVMMPLTIITGIFGMNTVSDLIFIKDFSDFFFIIGAMVLTAFVMFLFFRFRKWL